MLGAPQPDVSFDFSATMEDVDSGAAPAVFCVMHRRDLLAYARSHTRSWQDTEAVLTQVDKPFEIVERRAESYSARIA